MILQGKDIIIYNQSGSAVVALAKDGRITVETDTEEVASATQADFREYRTTRKTWKLTLNHLVTPQHLAGLLHVGNVVPISLRIDSSGSLPFDGFVEGVSVESISPILFPTSIWWDTSNEYFMAENSQGQYFCSWIDPVATRYMYPAEGALFRVDNSLYIYDDGILAALDAINGNAIVRRCDISAPVGGLAKGVLELQGSGTLAAATE